MYHTEDHEHAKEKLKEKYKLEQKRNGRYSKPDLKRAMNIMKRRVALNTEESWKDQGWLQRRILNAPAKAVAKQDPNLLFKHQVRHDDAETYLKREKLPFYEIQNMRIRRVSSRCMDAGGGKKCSCRSVYWHPKAERFMCWRCTSWRSL